MAAVVSGVGIFRPEPDSTAAEVMAIEAVVRACADAGIDPAEVDGLVKYSYDGSISTMAMARELNSRESRFSIEFPHGGGASGTLLETARMAVESGVAQNVVCFRSVSGDLYKKQLNMADWNRPYYLDTVNYLRRAGFTTYLHLFAPIFDEHARRYGTTKETLGRIAIELRDNAIASGNRSPDEALDMAAYMAEAPYVGELGDLDDFTVIDVASAFVVTSEERVSDRTRPVVEIVAAAQSHGTNPMGWHDLMPLSPTGLDNPARHVADRLWEDSGMSPDDIDVACLYDCTSVTFMYLLEQTGLCKAGSVPELVADAGVFSATGARPANLDGGDLEAGYTHGFRHIVEAVQQLRATSTNQVVNAETALVMGGPGSVTSGAVLRRKDLS